jgi:hypothetical protein
MVKMSASGAGTLLLFSLPDIDKFMASLNLIKVSVKLGMI